MQSFLNLYEKKKEIEKNLFQTDVFEGISLTTLSRDNRIYLQLVYACYNVPWGTIKLMMMPIYGEHGFAKATSKLIKEGWLYKEKFGGENSLAVTRKTLQMIYPKMDNLEKVPIKEGSIGFNKARSLVIAGYILRRYKQFLIESFNNLSAEEKQRYIQNQYLSYIQYRKFIELELCEQEKISDEWGLTKEEKEILTQGKMKKMNAKAIKLFTQKYPFSPDKGYSDFLKGYKERLNTIECFHLLRDLKINNKKTFDMLQVLQEMPTNLMERGFKNKFFDIFLSSYLNINVCKAECTYTKITGVKQIVEGCTRKNLQQLKEEVENEKSVEESNEVKNIIKRKEFFQTCLGKLNQQLEELYKTKLLLVSDEQGKKIQVTFDRLKQNGIFIKHFGLNEKGAYIEWVILDNVLEGLKGNLIAHRVFMLDSFMSNLFQMGTQVTYTVEIVTYALTRRKALQKEIAQAHKKLQGFKGQFTLLEIKIFELIEELEPKYVFWKKFIAML